MNEGFTRMFAREKLTLGLFFAIDSYEGDMPALVAQGDLAKVAEELGFAALWFRDVPLRDPGFGDVGQIFDTFVYLGYIAAKTKSIALATGSVIFPLRHPLHLAKSVSSVDQLSNGRLVLGVSTGDRPVEYPAFGVSFENRGELFREHLEFFKKSLYEYFPEIELPSGKLSNIDLVPKPFSPRVPLLITGHSQQSIEWISQNGDGWLNYPRTPELQERLLTQWREKVLTLTSVGFKPFSQSLYIDLQEDQNSSPIPMHLGYRLGRKSLIDLLDRLKSAGVNHVAINLKYGRRPAKEVMLEIGEEVVPYFPALN